MSELKVLRPRGKSVGAYHWVHLDADGKPLCGEGLSEYIVELLPEVWDEKTTVCGGCRALENHYSVRTIQAGQSRRYGPTEYIYDVTDFNKEKRIRPEVLAFCQAHVKKSYLKEDMPHAFAPRMAELTERVGNPGTWRYHVFCESTH